MKHIISTFEQLQTLSNSLPTLDKLVINKSPGKASYRTKKLNGSESIATSETILSESKVGIMRFKMNKGDIFENHKHSSNEWIIVISGSFITYIDGTKQIVKKGGYVYYPSDSSHGGTVLETLDCICITVPKAKGYPNGD